MTTTPDDNDVFRSAGSAGLLDQLGKMHHVAGPAQELVDPSVDHGLTLLRELQAIALNDLHTRPSAEKEIAKYIANLNADDIRALAFALEDHPDTCAPILLSLGPHRAVLKFLRDAAATLRASRAGDRPHRQSGSLAAAVGAPETWPDYPIPTGYGANAAGIHKVQITEDGPQPGAPVAPEPIAIVGARRSISDSTERIAIGYRRHGQWRTVEIPREDMVNSRLLVKHGAVGMPVNSGNSADLVAFLAACETAGGQAIAATEYTTRTGWHGDEYISGPGGPMELSDESGEFADWRADGTFEDWRDGIGIIAAHPVPWVLLYAACVGPLLRWLDLGFCPIVDLAGPSGRGKTTCMRLAASVYGRPEESAPGGSIRTWSLTPSYIERIAARTWDAALLIDDSRRRGANVNIGEVLYMLAQGRGKGRATIGGVQATSTWRTVILSTGEAPVIEATEAGGARNRVLSITTTPPLPDRNTAELLESAVKLNYGHLAPKLSGWAAGWGSDLREMHRAEVAAWAKIAPAADTRLLRAAAAICVAAEAASACGVPEPECDWRAELERSLGLSVREADQGARALDAIRNDLARSSHLFYGHPDARDAPPGGWRGLWACRPRGAPECTGYTRLALEDALRAAGHTDTSAILARWRESGVLVPGPTGSATVSTSIAGASVRVYALRRDALALADEAQAQVTMHGPYDGPEPPDDGRWA